MSYQGEFEPCGVCVKEGTSCWLPSGQNWEPEHQPDEERHQNGGEKEEFDGVRHGLYLQLACRLAEAGNGAGCRHRPDRRSSIFLVSPCSPEANRAGPVAAAPLTTPARAVSGSGSPSRRLGGRGRSRCGAIPLPPCRRCPRPSWRAPSRRTLAPRRPRSGAG